MSRKDNRDFIYLIWKDPSTRRNYTVGELSKNGLYEFSYGHEINEAIKKGFEPLISFEDISKVYKSDTLFPTFTSRLPDPKRRGIEKILSKYDLNNYDSYELLKKSGGRLPIDNLEFIDPIFEDFSKDVKREFYLAGVRHYIGCDGKQCDISVPLNIGEELELILEPENDYDENAIKVIDRNKVLIGYIPRYYSKELTIFIRKGVRYNCKVIEVNKDEECAECIRIELEICFSTKKYRKIS